MAAPFQFAVQIAHAPHPAFHQSRFQIAPDQLQHPFVLHPARHSRHQHIVVHPVKELLQVDVHDPPLAFGSIAPCGFHRLVRAVRDESRSSIRKTRVRIAVAVPDAALVGSDDPPPSECPTCVPRLAASVSPPCAPPPACTRPPTAPVLSSASAP